MSKDYNMEDLGIEALIGRKVYSAKINTTKDLVVLDTDKGPLYLTWEGDCCASCFLANVSGSDNLINATVLKARNDSWKTKDESEDFRVVESMGSTVKTDKGYVTFETRLEHNGYYGGNIMVSDDEPMDQYHSPRYKKGSLPGLTFLEDF